MKKWFRNLLKIHRWAAWLAALPALLILGTGILLSLRQNIAWMQPAIQKGTPGIPTIALTSAYEIAKSVPEAEITQWKDLKSIEVKPAAGVLCLRTANGYEIQLDGGSGKILSVAPRRTTFLVTLHEGTYFHPVIRWGVVFPAGMALFLLSCTGIGILILPYLKRVQGEK